MLAHPGWPGETPMRRNAEAALGQGNFSASTAVAFFRRFPPQNATAWVRFAQALNGIGCARRGEERGAQRAGCQGILSNADEAFVLTTFPDALTDGRSRCADGPVAVAGTDERGVRARSC